MSLAAAKYRFVTRQQYVESSIHLFRALLRECTYLPDPASQVYFKQYIKHRFKNAARRGNPLLRRAVYGDEAFAKDAKVKLEQALRKGYKGLSQLIRANEGEIKPLMRILRYTYGRDGPRRYEMLRTLLVPDVVGAPRTQTRDITTVPVPDALEPPKSVTGDTIVYTISDRYSKLKAIVQSQLESDIASERTKLSKRIAIPATNSWGRPMPRKRVKNMIKKQYTKLIDAILTPLQEHQWLHLQGLATGKIPWEGCKPRRRAPDGRPLALTSSDLEKLVHISDDFGEHFYLDSFSNCNPAASKKEKILALAGDERNRGYWAADDAWLDDKNAVDSAFETVLEDELRVQTLNKNIKGKDRGHRITPRLMRRLWMRVFKECPMLKPDKEAGSNHWKVFWGGPESNVDTIPHELFVLKEPKENQNIQVG
ncbi:uncharacterized protein PV09_00652 [Verruconis gallopava]|uniref:LYR motif-containing protein Cup1-like N-terminal domain-containing protein n=1 Tax=Verruconis gallopava TaxID=253628 RepID=A0A0D2AQB4_9PEZI|nr:uncharacterized protein PV09_00652 [Verruconis gallopava]KIW08705.1 hypothetical protein PV09_00652 [Verruconis gallopava]